MLNESIRVKDISSTKRFLNRAENYARFRPGYPDALFAFIEETTNLEPTARIADIGSGTGLFAEPLLKRGYAVVGIEPNDEMRKAGEERLKKYRLFQSIDSTAENTTLPKQSADLITVAQTFHWVDPIAAQAECRRILNPQGHIMLAWNRQGDDTAFEKKYSALRGRFRLGEAGPNQINRNLINDFFSPAGASSKTFPNKQLLDFDALKGQLLSKSYIPLPGHPTYDAMITELIQLFVAHNENGLVAINYETLVFWGQLT